MDGRLFQRGPGWGPFGDLLDPGPGGTLNPSYVIKDPFWVMHHTGPRLGPFWTPPGPLSRGPGKEARP